MTVMWGKNTWLNVHIEFRRQKQTHSMLARRHFWTLKRQWYMTQLSHLFLFTPKNKTLSPYAYKLTHTNTLSGLVGQKAGLRRRWFIRPMSKMKVFALKKRHLPTVTFWHADTFYLIFFFNPGSLLPHICAVLEKMRCFDRSKRVCDSQHTTEKNDACLCVHHYNIITVL